MQLNFKICGSGNPGGNSGTFNEVIRYWPAFMKVLANNIECASFERFILKISI